MSAFVSPLSLSSSLPVPSLHSSSPSVASLAPPASSLPPYTPESLDDFLVALFAPSPVPPFERTDTVLSALDSLCSFISCQCRLADLSVAEFQQRSTEYKQESDRIDRILSFLCLSFPQLPKPVQSSLDILSKACDTLSVSSSEPTAFAASVLRLRKSMEAVAKMDNSERDRLSELKRWGQELGERADEISKWQVNAQESKAAIEAVQQTRQGETEYFQAKSREYQSKIRATERKYMDSESQQSQFGSPNSAGNGSISSPSSAANETLPRPLPPWHDASILRLQREFDELESSLKSVKSELGQFHDLPPNIQLAAVKLKESEAELARLEMELDRGVTEMAIQSGREFDQHSSSSSIGIGSGFTGIRKY